ncbi:MAG TPA: hypothetical protein VM241_03835 [Candidatus Thermoplasmatota archaeon]|nr:hypothetical protein [Candidatus Thermoplasmatota archaeon]
MASQLSNNQVTGIVLIVLGILALAGWLSSLIILAAGVILLVYGIVVLLGKARSSHLVGILCVVAGALLILGYFPLLGTLVHALTVVIGVVLIVVGVLKLLGKM